MVNTFVLHFRPVRVPAKTLAYTHTFGLGGMSLVLVVLLVLTGGLLMFVYEPAPERAYNSIVRLQEQVRTATPVSRLVRYLPHQYNNLVLLPCLISHFLAFAGFFLVVAFFLGGARL